MKYFYTEPLAAAWMAKHFGMVFLHENGEVQYGYVNGFDSCEPRNCERKHYIHPDSLHLLEPLKDDVVEYISLHQEGYIVSLVYFDVGNPSQVKKIIQRNNIAFMWPESEEV